MLLHFGAVPVLVVSSADLAREIMKTHDLTFASRPAVKLFKKLFYDRRDVALAPYGEPWRKMKSILVLKLLSNKRVQATLTRARRNGPSREDDSRIFRGCELKYSESGNEKRFLGLFSDLLELIGSFTVGDFIPWLSWIGRVNGFDKRVDRVAKEVDQVLERMIQERLEIRRGQENGKSFLDLMLENNNNGDDRDDDLYTDRDI